MSFMVALLCVCSCTQYIRISVWLVVPGPFLVRCRVVALPVPYPAVIQKILESIRVGARSSLVPLDVANWRPNNVFWGV